jgi:hypothetical protein
MNTKRIIDIITTKGILDIITIIIAVTFIIFVMWFLESAQRVTGEANRIWNIELFVLGAATIGCFIVYIRKQRAEIPPSPFDAVWDILTPIVTAFASMQMYVHFANAPM